MQPSSTRRATIAAARAPGSDWYECIALATTHPASFLTSNSSLAKRSITSAGSGVFISRSSCAGVPAATLDIAQHASFRVCILALCSTAGSISRMPWSRTCCVASSDPDIIELIARMPGRRTASGPDLQSSTRRGTAPAMHTVSIISLGPSERYEIAHAASACTSESSSVSSFARSGTAGATSLSCGCGLPRTRLESAHVPLRVGEILPSAATRSRKAQRSGSAFCASTRSRIFGWSPAMLPTAHTACSATSMFADESSCTSGGSASASTTAAHCDDVPEAMLVRHLRREGR